MSKSDGPAANSFECPRKVGWLYKQGGSGVTSHWRKRWFVVDHHYLFYYKKPDDKNPVGILCLPEYDSCHKSEGKEWKKPNTFMLEKGKDSADPTDGPSKSYVLHSDTENEMLEWMNALKEEMKPMLDAGKHESLPNGRGQAPVTKSKGKSKSEADVKVDPKAFNELSVLASETPKLTHLTTSRPKFKNRRPPKKYAVFHEDDSKEEESPPLSPITKPLPSPPTPSATGVAKKLGHRPSAPLIPSKPSKPLTPPKERRNETSPSSEIVESDASLPEKKGPPPPRKPSKPSPPSKSSKPSVQSTEPAESENVPVAKKPRPQPPVKPRSSTQAIPPQPVPKPRPRRRTHVTPDTMATEETTPTVTDKETEPRVLTEEEEPVLAVENDVSAAEDVAEERETVAEETTPAMPEETTPTKAEVAVSPTPAEELSLAEKVPESGKEVVDLQESTEEEETKDETEDKPEGVSKESQSGKLEEQAATSTEEGVASGEIASVNDDTVSETKESAPVDDGGSKESEEVKKGESVSVEPDPSQEGKEDESKSDSAESLYEDMTMGFEDEEKKSDDSGSEYEQVDFEPIDNNVRHDYDDVPTEHFVDKNVDISVDQTSSVVPLPMETSSKGQSTSSYVIMNPTSPVNKSEYEDMGSSVFTTEISDNHEYDKPSDWGLTGKSTPKRTKIGEYDVPPPARPASTHSANSVDRGSPGLVSSSGSTGSRSHGSPGMPRKGSKGQSDRLSALRAEVVDKTVDRDRSPSGGSQGYVKPRTPSTPSIDSTHSVSGTLQQAKEILRLAHMVKAEADEMKEEARRELELARRERHDAELLKKNAGHILKMAKERLSGSKTR